MGWVLGFAHEVEIQFRPLFSEDIFTKTNDHILLFIRMLNECCYTLSYQPGIFCTLDLVPTGFPYIHEDLCRIPRASCGKLHLKMENKNIPSLM